jgi:hypothetical protein
VSVPVWSSHSAGGLARELETRRSVDCLEQEGSSPRATASWATELTFPCAHVQHEKTREIYCTTTAPLSSDPIRQILPTSVRHTLGASFNDVFHTVEFQLHPRSISHALSSRAAIKGSLESEVGRPSRVTVSLLPVDPRDRRPQRHSHWEWRCKDVGCCSPAQIKLQPPRSSHDSPE